MFVRMTLTLGLTAILAGRCWPESIETQSNSVTNGQIQVAADDPDRSDWEGIMWYEYDDDFSEFSPVDIDRVQIAHDAANVYIHIQTLNWDVDETWRVGTYLDTDLDTTTGYTGNFLPLGADYFLEDEGSYRFTAPTQADWGWEQSGDVVRDQSNMIDVELSIPRAAIGNPEIFDFILFANNMCCDFGLPDDIYPNEPGGVFTYELGSVADPADCNGDGAIDAADLACVTQVEDRDTVLAALNSLPGDLDGNGDVAFADFLVLSANFGTNLPSYTAGNIDLTGGIEFADFLILSANFGQSANAAAVPEPCSGLLLAVGLFLAGGRLRSRG